MYVIPPEQSAEFVVHMEDVLEIYHLPYDPKCPVICMDEQPIQLVKETRIPLPVVWSNVWKFTTPPNMEVGEAARSWGSPP
jgi:hypothetical protein